MSAPPWKCDGDFHGFHWREPVARADAAGSRRGGPPLRRFSAAEDAVQEALLAAAMQWPEKGVPDNPRGWLIQVAARRMTDHLRAELARRRREVVVAMQMRPTRWRPQSTARTTRIRTTRSSCCSCAVTLR